MIMADFETTITRKAEELERQELEAPGGVAPPEVYSQLLAIYLYQKDLCNAKFLWKRIPASVKSSHSELTALWNVGQMLWRRDHEGFYEALNHEWSEPLVPVMTALLESSRERAVGLVSRVYSSISASELAAKVGLPQDEAVQAAVAVGWTFDSQSQMLEPKKPDEAGRDPLSCEDQLHKLTDFVTFLEN